MELFSSCADGKLQWEEEAVVNRLQSSEVGASVPGVPNLAVGGGVEE